MYLPVRVYPQEKSSTFCIYPFVHYNVKTNGRTSLCNRCQPIGSLDDDDLASFWNSDRVKAIRRQLLNNERPKECEACWILEDSGATSYRQAALEHDGSHRSWFNNLEHCQTDGSMPLRVRELELRFSNKCNMSCKMCGPKFSSKWQQILHQQPEFRQWLSEDPENRDIYHTKGLKFPTQSEDYQKKMLDLIDANGEHLEYLMITGGEPLLYEKLHYDILDRLLPRASEITLEYTSNLSTLNDRQKKILDYWLKFNRVILKVSLDADPVSYPLVRNDQLLSSVEKNILEVKEVIPGRRLYFIGTCTTSAYNVARLPEIMKYITSLGLWAHTSIVEYPTFLSPQVLPNHIKKQIAERCYRFLDNLDTELAEEFKLPFWQEVDTRVDRQKARIIKWTSNCVRFMLGNDQSHLFEQFLKFNSFLDNNNRMLFELYPEFRESQYVAPVL